MGDACRHDFITFASISKDTSPTDCVKLTSRIIAESQVEKSRRSATCGAFQQVQADRSQSNKSWKSTRGKENEFKSTNIASCKGPLNRSGSSSKTVGGTTNASVCGAELDVYAQNNGSNRTKQLGNG